MNTTPDAKVVFKNLVEFHIKPISCKPDTSINEVLAILKENSIGAVPIVDDQATVLGIFTERDFLTKIAGADQNACLDKPVSGYMTPDPKVVKLEDEIENGIYLMVNHGFRHLVVVHESGKLANIFSIKDALNHLFTAV